MALMISVSGIRGIFGTDLTPQNLAGFTAAYGTFVQGGTVVVGRDSRVTGQICEDIICATLQSVGCDVIRLGIVPTPTVAMAVEFHKAQGGIIISASHNPAQWNALKLLDGKGEFLSAADGKKVVEIAESNAAQYVDYTKIGSIKTDNDAIERHINEIIKLPYINLEQIRARKFSVIADAVNGAGAIALPLLFEALGCSYEILFGEPNGLFPHNPEPLPEHLGEICSQTESGSFDIGFVTDPDADRLAVVDNNGKLWGEEYTITAAFELLLSHKNGDICMNLSSSMISDDIAKKFGVECHRSAVGEVNVVAKMREHNCVIGGEGNGGVINPDLHYGRDALVGIAMILQYLCNTGLSSSAYRESLNNYHIVKNKWQLEDINADEVLKNVANKFENERIDFTDGVKIYFTEGWVHLRKSNTEPIIRIYSEAKTVELAQELSKRIME